MVCTPPFEKHWSRWLGWLDYKKGIGKAHSKHKRKEKSTQSSDQEITRKSEKVSLPRKVKVYLSHPNRQTETEEVWINNW